MDIPTLWSKVRAMVRRLINRNVETEAAMTDELESFIAHEIDSRIAGGMEPETARRTALAEFGGHDQVKEQMRDGRTGAWLDTVRQDLRYGARLLWHSPGFTVPVVGSLSVGIAVTVAGLAFINALLLRPFPGVDKPDEVVELVGPLGSCRNNCFIPAPQDLPDIEKGLTTLANVSLSTYTKVVVVSSTAQSVNAEFVSPAYFDVLGVHPAMGHFYEGPSSFSDGGIVISYLMWRNELHSDPSVIGRPLRVGNRTLEIVGVAPKSFLGTSLDAGSEESATALWPPLPLFDVLSGKTSIGARYHWLERRKPGIPIEAVNEQEQAVYAAIAALRSKTTGRGLFVAWQFGMIEGDPARVFGVKAATLVILIVPLLVLTIASANAANLLLARGARRSREIAIRMAIGGARSRVVRQIVSESLIVGTASTVIALPLGAWGLQSASSAVGIPMPLDPVVLALTLLTAFVCTLGFSLRPALKITSQHPIQALGTSSTAGPPPEQMGERRRLVVIQVALTMLLLIVGSEILTVLQSRQESANAPADTFLAYFDLSQLKKTPAESATFYQSVRAAVSHLPEVESAAIGPPLWVFGGRLFFPTSIRVWRPQDSAETSRNVSGGEVSEELFQTAGFPIIEGRGFEAADYYARSTQPAIVTRTFAKDVLGGPAIGSTVRLAPGYNAAFASAVEVRIVGVVDDWPGQQPETPTGGHRTEIFVSHLPDSPPAQMLYIHLRTGSAGTGAALAKAVHDVDPTVPVIASGTVQEFNAKAMPSVVWWLIHGAILLAFIGLALSAAGLYGVMSYMVSMQSREIAIRMTVGATPHSILAMVWKQAITLVVIGLAAGLPLAAAIAYAFIVHNELWTGIHHINPVLFAGATALTVVTMMFAGLIPSVRASQVDPIQNLKTE